MARKLRLVKGASRRGSLVYGMRMFGRDGVLRIDPARVTLAGEAAEGVTMHLIEGTRAQIRRQLEQSIDAFFELLDEEK
ncbi:MAG: allantoinase [Candidatus Binataceae bacterium]